MPATHLQTYLSAAIQQPPEPIFELAAAFEKDPKEMKVNVSVGAYRDQKGRSWVLGAVKKARTRIYNDPTAGHEYLPIAGLSSFTDAALRLAFGTDQKEKVAAVQTISGTGALRIGAEYLYKIAPKAIVYLPEPTWSNHKDIFADVGLQIRSYSYYDKTTKGLDFTSMMNDIKDAPEKSIILLHACAHNPTGVDPSKEQWTQILDLIKSKKHFTFFDMAYQGFASGSPEEDAFAVRKAFKQGLPLFVAQSFAKNFGLYGERVGALSFAGENIATVKSHLCAIIRCHFSCGPSYGARIVSIVLNDPVLHKEWSEDLLTMSRRIAIMRSKLFNLFVKLGTPGDWTHIMKQIGMFSYTGLSPRICQRLVDECSVYLPLNGRISIAGLNDGNIKYFAECIDRLVKEELLESPPAKKAKISATRKE